MEEFLLSPEPVLCIAERTENISLKFLLNLSHQYNETDKNKINRGVMIQSAAY